MILRPKMPTVADEQRAIRQSVRWGMLNEEYGGEDDSRIREWFIAQVGDEMADLLSVPDISGNLLVSTAAMLTTPGLYGLGSPRLLHADASGQVVAAALEACGYWSRMQWIEYLAAGLGDALVCLEVEPEGLCVRTVPPQDVYVVTAPHDPSRVVELGELRMREIEGLGICYAWDVFRTPAKGEPTFTIEAETERGRVDVPLAAAGVELASPYPWRYADGRPFIPYVHYSRLDTGNPWHDTQKRGLTRAALNSILWWTFTGRCAIDAAHGSDVFAGLEPPSASMIQTGDGGSMAGPARVLRRTPGQMLFLQTSEGAQPFHAALGAGASLPTLLSFCIEYGKHALLREGISGEDYSSGPNPQSASAMALSQSAKRRVAERVRPLFTRRDQEAIAKASALLRVAGLPTGPERGYALEYQQLPASVEEAAAERDAQTWRHSERLISRVDLYMHLHPGVERAHAVAELQRVDAEEAALGVADTTTTTEIP